MKQSRLQAAADVAVAADAAAVATSILVQNKNSKACSIPLKKVNF